MRRKRGQSILEYVIVLTAIVAAIAFVAAQMIGPAIVGPGGLGENTRDTLKTAGDHMPTF